MSKNNSTPPKKEIRDNLVAGSGKSYIIKAKPINPNDAVIDDTKTQSKEP